MAAVKVTEKSRGSGGEKGRGGGWVIVDGSEDLLTRRRHKTKATMQILQKQQFTDDNLRQVTSQPEASVTHPHPLLVLGPSWAPVGLPQRPARPPVVCVCFMLMNLFIIISFFASSCSSSCYAFYGTAATFSSLTPHSLLALPPSPPPNNIPCCQLHNAEN